MLADTSQTAPQGTPAPADTSLSVAPPSVSELAPGNTDTPSTPQPPQATAGAPTTGNGGETAAVVDNDDGDYARQKAAFLSGKPVTVETPSAAPAPTDAPAAVPAPAVTLPDPADTLEDVGNGTETDGRPKKMHVRPVNAQDRNMLSEWKASQVAGNKVGLVEFILSRQAPAAASSDAPSQQQTAAVETPTVPVFTSVEEIDAEITRLTDLEYEELDNFRAPEAKKHRVRVQELMRMRPKVEAAAQQAVELVVSEKETQWQADVARAQKLFPDAGKQGPLEAKAVEIRQRWIQTGHPLAYSPQSAIALYGEAAEELGIQPGSTTASPPVSASPMSTTTAVQPFRPPAAIIAGGDARSQQTRALDPSQTGMDSYEAEKAALLKGR